MNNPVLDVIASRSSIRDYTPEPLTADEISALKQAALAAPTARNEQNQRFYFITSPALKDEIDKAVVDYFVAKGDQAVVDLLASRNNKVLYDAPLYVAIAIDTNNPYGKVDAGIAVQNLALAAKSMGLDSVILGFPGMAFQGAKGADLKKKLGFPDGFEYGIGISIGHAAKGKEPHQGNPEHIITIA